MGWRTPPDDLRRGQCEESNCPGTTGNDERKTVPGHYCYQPIIEATDHPIFLCDWGPGLVGRNPSPPPISSNQTGPKTIWTIQDHKRNIPCRLSVTSSCSLEHP